MGCKVGFCCVVTLAAALAARADTVTLTPDKDTTLIQATAGNLSSYIVIDRDDQPYQGTLNNVMGGYPPGVVVAN